MRGCLAGRVVRFWAWVTILGAAGCASTGGGSVGAVDLSPPQPAHGDDLAIAWPFTLLHGGDSETLADFHLRIEQGATLVAVRPDRENPDPGARFNWRGEVRDGTAYWIGDPLIPGDGVTLTILLATQTSRIPSISFESPESTYSTWTLFWASQAVRSAASL